MAVVVMGMKGREYLLELKKYDDNKYKYYLKHVFISGYYEIGWALIIAVVASLINFLSFGFFLLEYKDMTEMRIPRPTKV
ncbi:hypothetical protein ACF0H5_005293 [Mactra antiquata]